jgi:hypothetical protein
MSDTVRHVIKWLQILPPDAEVGVDEGGLTLIVVGDPEPYFELGGVPDEDEEDERACDV